MHRALRPGGGPSALDELYRCGARVDAVDEKCRTALHIAAATGYDEAVLWLLQHGADVRLVATDGRSALHAAAAAGHVSATRLLVDAASNISRATAAHLLALPDADGRTPAEVAAAAMHMDVVRELLQAITGPQPKARFGSNRDDVSGDRSSSSDRSSRFVQAPHRGWLAAPPYATYARPPGATAPADATCFRMHPTTASYQIQPPGALEVAGATWTAPGAAAPRSPPQIEVLEGAGSQQLERLVPPQRRGYGPVLHTPASSSSAYNGMRVTTP